MPKLSAQDEARLLQILSSDPEIQSLIAQRTAARGGSQKFQYGEPIQQRARALGLPDDYRLEGLTTGKPLALDHQNVFQKYGDDAVRYAAGTITAAGANRAQQQVQQSLGTGGSPVPSMDDAPGTPPYAPTNNSWKDYLYKYVIPAAITTGAKVYASKQSKDAIDKAQQAQQAGTDAARAEQQRVTGVASDIYNQQRADLAPYREGGAQAYSTLGGLMGFTPAAGAASAPMPTTTAPAVPDVAPVTGRHMRPESEPTGTYAGPRGGTLADIQQGAVTQRQSSYGDQPARIQAPNGQVYLVPRNRVQEALANGGQAVG